MTPKNSASWDIICYLTVNSNTSYDYWMNATFEWMHACNFLNQKEF